MISFDPIPHHAEIPRSLHHLPDEVRKQARQAYLLFRENPRHPSLRFKKVDEQGNIYSIRVGLRYRALGGDGGLESYLVLDRITLRLRPATLIKITTAVLRFAQDDKSELVPSRTG